MQRLAKSRTLFILAATLALAGCGNSGASKEKAEVKQFVVVSAVDCADNTGLEFEKCVDVLQKAISEHDKTAVNYPKLEACEKAEGGADRCDRIGEKSYRARLTAFQITMSEPPAALPLYPSKAATPGFRTTANVEIAADADKFTFTKSAADAAYLYVGSGKKKEKGLMAGK